MTRPVAQMTPAELYEHFTADDLKAMVDSVADDPDFDPGFRQRITDAAAMAGHAVSAPA
ncbi:hypothetical protein [Longimicrobium terrae]|uniref:Uncharacterized protein n=1 Tax=Longimicrobium terrae TaxID=1639882 RepID=A0A841GRY0_9BACT|nr:hypothetical protein [Longimicrobium terrae]MBB4634051.1 hypothetical protein [Longimicrobium terrae]MBB6069059.1 hypothetical protein [Longimicrobium terrae]NNC28235.1 hypothetical protein [Longimicrobium terrae]